jgi:protein associated with RNAse G/E
VADEGVRVIYRKYDGALHWHQTMRRLGEDEFGVWLGVPAGMVARRGENGPTAVLEHPIVMLFPTDDWWTASFRSGPAGGYIYVDITTPPRWPHSGEVTMVDLDLDVIRRQDLSVAIVDQDEFAEHQVRYGYPPDVIAAAERAADRLHAALVDGAEPFAGGYRRWLELVS